MMIHALPKPGTCPAARIRPSSSSPKFEKSSARAASLSNVPSSSARVTAARSATVPYIPPAL